MDNSKNSEVYTFGKLENNENSDSEESFHDCTDENSVSEKRADGISSKTDENQQRLVKEMERLTSTDSSISSYLSSAGSSDGYKKSNYNGTHTDAIQPRPIFGVNAERRNYFRTHQRTRGNWSFRCDSHESNSDGLTEADTIWTAINELSEKETSLFFLKPDKFPSRYNFVTINCYTPDYRDEEFVLKVIDTVRKHVYFPYVTYYYKSNVKFESIYMHTPNGEFYRKKENSRWEFIDRV